MYCQNCSRMVSTELGELEVEVDVEDDAGLAKVTGNVKLSLNCVQCTESLRQGNLEVDVDVKVNHGEDCEDGEFELQFAPTALDYFFPPNAKRKRHMYGAEGTVEVTCTCKSTASVAWKQEIQSSAMENV